VSRTRCCRTSNPVVDRGRSDIEFKRQGFHTVCLNEAREFGFPSVPDHSAHPAGPFTCLVSYPRVQRSPRAADRPRTPTQMTLEVSRGRPNYTARKIPETPDSHERSCRPCRSTRRNSRFARRDLWCNPPHHDPEVAQVGRVGASPWTWTGREMAGDGGYTKRNEKIRERREVAELKRLFAL
jgi:hypothetical protein